MTARELKVLYLLPAEGFGGAERQGLLHLAELPRQGVEVTALVGPSAPIALALREAGVDCAEPFECFPDHTHEPLSLASDAAYLAHWLSAVKRSAREIERRVRGKRFELIFANRTFAWLVAALVSRRLGIPYVLRA
ncbi:MAG TPA: hypothetical protein VGP93_15905, partial [Polyangiaceae bacterium]|nr:hypothetical protein [Polyangiaceae bacterium]